MYKINAFTVNKNEKFIPQEMPHARFAYYKDAQRYMMQHMMTTVQSLVQTSHENQMFSSAFTPHLDYFVNGQKVDGVIRRWDIPADIKGDIVALFQIAWVNEEDVDEWNKKLKDAYGDELTLWIESVAENEEMGIPSGRYMTVFHGTGSFETDFYDTPEDAYKAAREYMDSRFECDFEE